MNDLRSRLFILYDGFSSKEDYQEDNPLIEDGPSGKVFYWIKGLWLKESEGLEDFSCRKYEELFGVAPILTEGCLGPFHNVEELRRYAYLLCLDLEGEVVHLASQEIFNDALKYSPDKQALLSELIKKSDFLDNIDRSKARSLLDKIFTKS